MWARTAFIFVFGLVASYAPITSSAQQVEIAQHAPDGIALSAYRGLVEEHIGGVLRSLRIVAACPEAKVGDWERVKPLLIRLSEDLQTDATAWFALPDGSYFVTEVGGVTEQNLKDRSYFPELMAGNEIVGDLVISKSTGHRSVIIATPVDDGGKVVGGIGISLRVRLLSDLVGRYLPMPNDGYFFALDRDTKIVLHRMAERMFKTPSDVGDEALGAEFRRALESDSGTLNYVLQGQRISSRFERSPTLEWYFFLAIPTR